MEKTNDLVSSPTSSTKIDDDAAHVAEMMLAKAKFQQILSESIGVRADRKKEKKRKEKSKKRKGDKKKRKSKKDKGKKEKSKVNTESEEQKLNEMLEKIRLKKDKLKLKKEKEKKKKKPKKKKKKRISKTKTSAIDVSDQESVEDCKPMSWWSLATEDYEAEDEKKTPVVSKTPRKKSKKRSHKKRVDQTDESVTDHSASTADLSTSVTGHTARSSLASSQPSFSSPLVRKVSDLSDYAMNSATVIWWDKVKAATPLTPTKASPSRTPATTPNMVPKKSVYPSFLLSPRSDASESDYDDVSIFSEESLSEQILDDLSCILDCSDESDNGSIEDTPASKRKSLKSLSNKFDDSSSICSDPFTLISCTRKPRSSRGTTADACKTPATGKHPSTVKIVSSRSLCSQKGNGSPCAISPSSLESPSTSLMSPTSPRSRSNTGSRTEPTRNTPRAEMIQTENSPAGNQNPVDGIQPISREGLFGNRRKAPNATSLPTVVPLA